MKKVNEILLWYLVAINIIDLALTWIGTQIYDYQEGNCFIFDSVMTGNLLLPAAIKIFGLSLFFYGVYSKKMNEKPQNQKIVFTAMAAISFVYTIVVIKWLFLIF